jgi:hypothetical protein
MAKPDFLNINPNIGTPSEKEETLEERFERERLQWSTKVSEMSEKMRKVMEIPELMTTLYTERQRAVEYYHYLITLMINLNKKYNASYTERQDYYTNKVQVRYPNESTKHTKILVDLQDLVEKRAMLDNHSKFISSTVQTLDNIIFAIAKRIEIEQISRGK